MEQRPSKPGWYWDPQELEFNLALRERWRREVVLSEDVDYRLRRWDGSRWTQDTLVRYSLSGPASVPHLLGPTTRVDLLTPEDASRNLRIWVALMVLASLVFLLSHLLL